MVAPIPKKPLFEGNSASNVQPLFFEFALEPTPVSFKPQPKLTTFPTSSKRRKALNIASRLVLGLIITLLVLGSGVLDNELFMGKSGTQANLSWIPSWSEDSPLISETNRTSIGIAEIAEAPSNPESKFISAGTNDDFSSTVDIPAEETVLVTTPTTEPDTKTTIATEPTETTNPNSTLKPIIKTPVTQPGVKLSTPVINREAAVANKSKITSDAFHEISAASAIDGKKVFIKFGAKWCLPCKMMERNVFPDPEIRQLLDKKYHTLTVDVDKIDGINLRQFYQVEALPSFIILDHQQNIVGKYEGAKRIEELRSILGSTAP